MSTFRSFLLDILDPRRLGLGEIFLEQLASLGECGLSLERFEFWRDLRVDVAGHVDDVALDESDVVLGEALAPDGSGNVDIGAGPAGFENHGDHGFRRARDAVEARQFHEFLLKLSGLGRGIGAA